MKHPILIALFLSATALPAQSDFSILKDLEGVWYQSGRNVTVYSEWRFTDAQTIENQIFNIQCGDTIAESRAVLRVENASATLLLWIDSLQTATPQTYRLILANKNEIIFKSENPATQPQQLAWQFFNHSYLTALADMEEYTFFRQTKKVMKAGIDLRMGVNLSTLAKRLDPLGSHFYQEGLGADLSVSLALRGQSRLGYNLELGLSQRNIGVFAHWKIRDTWYTQNGTYKNIDFFLAFVPELALGEKRRFTLSAGVFGDFARNYHFNGTSTASDANKKPPVANATFDIGYNTGVLGGLSWRLPKTVFSAWEPMLYCRGTLGMGTARMLAVSVGLGVRLK